jgi:mannose-6-phosphate isomerase-like protein (cupin superfamily)
MILVHEDDIPAVVTEGEFKRTLKVLLSPALDKAVDSIAVGLTIIPPGSKSDFISHAEREMFYVLSGEGAMRVGEETKPIFAGTAVWVGPHLRHQMINKGSATLKVLWVLSPPGRESLLLAQAGANG